MDAESVLTLAGRVAIVTGGSRNIGFAIAKKFVASGMRVAILSNSAGTAQEAADQLTVANDVAVGIQCDVSDTDAVREAMARVHQHFGGIDVLVNSAALLDVRPLSEISAEEWDRVLAVNVRGTFLACQQAIPYLVQSPAPRIINISSNAGRMGGFENGLAYTASKGAVISLTYGLARRLAGDRITVNCIAPGTIESDMLQEWDAQAQDRLLQRFPLGRFGTPEEVAAAACYFASEEAAFTTGAVLDVNGGMFMG